MNIEQLKKDIIPPELMLKLYGDIPDSEVEAKIELLDDFLEKVRDSYDEDVFKVLRSNQLAVLLWMAKRYQEVITHAEEVVHLLAPEDYPTYYFLSADLLIKCNFILSKYEKAEKWARLALENHQHSSVISNLHILNNYADVRLATNKPLDKKYSPLIQSIIDEYGFPEKLNDPLETIKSMEARHKYWNRQLSELILINRSDPPEYLKELENYKNSCEIEWYRNYAQKAINSLKNKK
ncbi:hypothetical protein [Algoriphagus halophytocola]|uniref:Tetratricopeptide repeat protein n=1 Tax=Algoriphagus halophytocola TaxID=2991499 RepID=A0ABY6MFP6_9BACT|nr:hypothetical protein [Algoriphagus sp. TR-M5]UZD22643.1 hypothetical protein OM944_18580 [Algoriphagus sp. TR-M5]